jgi:hypothetical protein
MRSKKPNRTSCKVGVNILALNNPADTTLNCLSPDPGIVTPFARWVKRANI